MGKGGGGGGPTETTVTQTDLPEYVRPFFERLLERGEALSKEEYQPYEGQRIADESEEVRQSRQMIEDLIAGGTPFGDEAKTAISDALDRIQRGQDFEAGDLTKLSGTIDYEDPEMFGAEVAQQYMSPYISEVLNRQKEAIRQDFARTQADRDFAAERAGAFGGSRQAVQQALAEEDLIDQLADVEATGLQTAFEQAQGQFERDRAAKQEAEQFRVEATQAAEESRLRAEVEQENLRVEAEKLGMTAAEASSLTAEKLADLEAKAKAGDVDSARLLEAIGKDKEAREQLQLDIDREDFIRQRDIPAERLQAFSALLRGIPISASTEASTMGTTNPTQELLGTGISALALYKALGLDR